MPKSVLRGLCCFEVGVSTWIVKARLVCKNTRYGPGYEGRRTASGEKFDPNGFSAASRTLPLGSIVRVTNIQNGRSVDVRINDRGPVTPGRSIDLSPAAARKIGLTTKGIDHVKITKISG